MGRARDIANVLSSSTNIALDSELGLSLITPTSVATLGGSASISSTGAVSFTSASAISLNGCFSSTYDNYKVIVDISGRSTAAAVNLRMRAAGTDNSSSTYYSGWTSTEAASNTIVYARNSIANVGLLLETRIGQGYASIDFIRPFLVDYSYILGLTNNPSDVRHFSGGISHLTSASYDGFSISASTGSLNSGIITVYGYRK